MLRTDVKPVLPKTFRKLTPLTLLNLAALTVLVFALLTDAVVTRIPREPFPNPGHFLLPPAPPQEQVGETSFVWSQQSVLQVLLFNPESFEKEIRFSFKVHGTPCSGEVASSILIRFRDHRAQLSFTETSAGVYSTPGLIHPGQTEIVTLKIQSEGCQLPDGRVVFFWLGEIKPTEELLISSGG